MKLAFGLAVAIAALILGSAAILAWHARAMAGGRLLAPADFAALRFTLLQAALSAGFSALLAVPVARALFRRRFWGQSALIGLMAAPFALPFVVAVLGLLTIFGRAGPVNMALGALGLPPFSIYGLHGVVMANVFFNLPLATRMLLHGWHAIPPERFRLAQSLSMPPAAQFRHLELPMLRVQLPGIAVTVFLICLTSFAISLTLGGGPKASTLELAIYQALRFEFDLGRAALLATVQFSLCAIVTLGALRLTLPDGFGTGLARQSVLFAPKGWRRGLDVFWIALAALYLLAPLLAALLRGLPGLADLPNGLWPALARSLAVALASALLTTVAALILALAAARPGRRWIELSAMLPLSASGLVLGTGLFLALRPFAQPDDLALPVTMLVNTLLALPFVFRLLLPQARQVQQNFDRLSESLGLTPMIRLRYVTLPLLARPLGYGAGLAAALSMGDLGVITLFAGQGGATLPLLVQNLIGAYRMDQAAAAALILVLASFSLFFLFDRWGARHADT